MNKKKALLIPLAVITVTILLVIGYIAIGFYYKNGFSFGTYVNGVYCTGKSVEEVNEELKNLYDKKYFFIEDTQGKVYSINLEKAGVVIDYNSQLTALQNSQNPFSWGANLFNISQNTMEPEIIVDREKLRVALDNCGIVETNAKENTVEIRKETGYILYDGMVDVLDMDLVCQVVEDALVQNQTEIKVDNCYVDLPYTEEMQQVFALWEKVNAFQTCGITYDMGDFFVELTPDIVCEWITLDENGAFLFDEEGQLIFREEGVEEFIADLCLEYDTYGSTRTFATTEGRVVTIEGGTYGNKLDRKAEIAYLKEAFLNNVEEVHVPTYEKEAYVRGKNDIGDTYVEIDMTYQRIYYYEDGELKFDTYVVTGNVKRKWDTPEGVNFVYNMQTDRILRGEGYATPVDYWVPVVGNIGIHDASWRTTFGGEIYKTDGSHGCINVPANRMGALYDMLEIGVPVVMFY